GAGVGGGSRGRGALISGPLDDLEADAAVGEGLLADGVAPLARFELGPLDGVGLQEAVEVRLLAPGARIVVVLHDPTAEVDDGGGMPVGPLQEQPAGLPAVELRPAPPRLRPAPPPARGGGGPPAPTAAPSP